ncbi:coiled-coil domain-containing protein [Leptolyngbya sp. AN03gr2]|uniref:coiled-coil domain-containing protein n=1 Tax=unclassified Leptolyngbya TaxID=2650499 RepID=UPI003D310CE0
MIPNSIDKSQETIRAVIPMSFQLKLQIREYCDEQGLTIENLTILVFNWGFRFAGEFDRVLDRNCIKRETDLRPRIAENVYMYIKNTAASHDITPPDLLGFYFLRWAESNLNDSQQNDSCVSISETNQKSVQKAVNDLEDELKDLEEQYSALEVEFQVVHHEKERLQTELKQMQDAYAQTFDKLKAEYDLKLTEFKEQLRHEQIQTIERAVQTALQNLPQQQISRSIGAVQPPTRIEMRPASTPVPRNPYANDWKLVKQPEFNANDLC